MLVAAPIGLYTSGGVALIVFAAGGSASWYHAAMVLWFAAVTAALLDAMFAAADLPRGGVAHFGLHVLAALLFASAAFMMLGDWIAASSDSHLRVAAPLAIGALGFAAKLVAACLGQVPTTGRGAPPSRRSSGLHLSM